MDKIDFTKPRVDFRKARGAMQDREFVDFTKSRIDFNAAPDAEAQKRLDPEVSQALDALLPPIQAKDNRVMRSKVVMSIAFSSAALFALLALLFWNGTLPEVLFTTLNLTSSWAGAISAILALFCGRVGLIGRTRARRNGSK